MTIKGKVLKIKIGYNPNSSSIGTEITAFIYGATIFTLISNSLFSIVSTILAKKKDNKTKK